MLNWLGKSGGQHQIGARQAAALVPGWRRDGVEIHPDSALSRSALLVSNPTCFDGIVLGTSLVVRDLIFDARCGKEQSDPIQIVLPFESVRADFIAAWCGGVPICSIHGFGLIGFRSSPPLARPLYILVDDTTGLDPRSWCI